MPDIGGLLREIEGLDPTLRQAIAASWADAALDEHASVASFARFSLHLLAVAAPPDLLVAAHRAGLDEIAHARACFEIAGAYAGEALSPGPLRLSGDLLGPLDLASIAAAAVIEGCVGETVASLEAREAAATARPESLRRALARIAEDEGRHAALAWRFVAWARQVGGPEVGAAVDAAFDQALATDGGPLPDDEPQDLIFAEHGRLCERARRQLREVAAQEVIAATRASLGWPPSPSR